MSLTAFISHNSKDKPFVRRIAKDLESQGIATWLDERRILGGHSISDAIQRGLDSADLAVLVMSPESIASSWVKEELRLAYQRRISTKQAFFIVPVLLRRCEIPGFLQDYKYIDFSNPRKYPTVFTELLNSIIFHNELGPIYRTEYAGGFIVNAINVTVNISGSRYRHAKFMEEYAILPLRRVSTINKRFEHDGIIEHVGLSNGKIRREQVGKTKELWKLIPDSPLSAREEHRFRLFYDLRNEFNFARTWYYTIDAPTRRFHFSFRFSQECQPRRLRVKSMQTQTVVEQRMLKPNHNMHGATYTFGVRWPGYKDWYEFEWN